MKKIALIISLFVSYLTINAQTTLNTVWLKGFGSSGGDEIKGSYVDASGNIYLTGIISGSVDLDPGPGSYTVSVSTPQAFFSKFNSAGNLIWARYLNGPGESEGTAITTNSLGDVYVVGNFQSGMVDFNTSSPGTNTYVPNNIDMYILKYTSNGAYTSMLPVASATSEVYPKQIYFDSNGDMIIGGDFAQNPATPLNFNPLGPTYTVSPVGFRDGFVAKYSPSLTLQFAIPFGSVNNDYLTAMVIDGANDIYVTGSCQSNNDFDPTTNTYTVDIIGSEGLFMCKYSGSTGAKIWAQSVSGSGADGGYCLKLDNNNDLLVYGFMASPSVDADPTTNTVTLTKVGTGSYDVFLGKYNSGNGNLIWAKNTGGTGDIYPFALTTDAQNNIYLSGAFDGVADFDLTTGVDTYTSVTTSGFDIYLAKYNSSGDIIFNYTFGGGSGNGNTTHELHITSNNEILMGGNFASTFDFDPSNASNTIPHNASTDVFINRYSQCISPDTPTLTVSSITICANTVGTLSISGGNLNSATNWVWTNGCGSSQISTGLTFTASPPFQTTYFVRGEGGCVVPGSCASATINIIPSKDLTGVVTTSSTVFVPGTVELYRKEGPLTKWDFVAFQNINASGVYTFNAVNAGNYIIMAAPTSPSLQTTYAPNATTWKNAVPFPHGCNANTTMNIDVLALTDLGGGPGVLSGKITEGVGYGNRGGIFVPGAPIGGLSIKGGKNPGGNIVAQGKTNASGDYTLSNLPISSVGESYFVFVDIPGLDTNGTYHKAVMTGSLQYGNLDFVVDSQYVNPTNFVGIKELTIDHQLVSVYPNPAKNVLHVTTELTTPSEIKMELTDMFGKLIQTKSYSNVQGEFKTSLNVADLTKGIYFIKIQVNSGESRLKIIISE